MSLHKPLIQILTDEALRSSPTAFIYTFVQTSPESSMCPAASQVLGTESQMNYGPRPYSKLVWKMNITTVQCDTMNDTSSNQTPDPFSTGGGTRGSLSGAPRSLLGGNLRHLVDGARPHTWPSRSGNINTGPAALNLPPRGQSWT